MMNLIKEFKENYLGIDEDMFQGIDKYNGEFNGEIEKNMFFLLCRKISDPIAKHFNYSLGEVYFMSDPDEDNILLKFRNLNMIFDTSESLENIINEINYASKIAYV